MYTLMWIGLIINSVLAFAMLDVNKGTAIINMLAATFCFIYLMLEPTENEDYSND